MKAPLRIRHLLRGAATALLAVFVSAASNAFAQQGGSQGSPNDLRKSNRRGPDDSRGRRSSDDDPVRMGIRSIRLPGEVRAIDGSGNNPDHPDWGAAETAFLRLVPADYADGSSAPAGADRPSARAVSNAVSAQPGPTVNHRGASDFLWQWGQFIDHDIDLTPVADPVEPFDVPVPTGDPFFDPQGTGTQVIGLDRSFHVTSGGVREQINEITAYIDASNVYGSDSARAEALRANDGTGRLLISAGDLLPFNTEGLPNAPTEHDPGFFLAGDFRANEQVGLTALHTLFVREHNYWASTIARSNPGMSGDEIYESARIIVAAELQAITYHEFLPVLLGPRALPRYDGYDPTVNAGIANEFATAAYRVGHTMLPSLLLRLDRRGREIAEGNLALADAFFDPSRITDEAGIDPLLRGLARQRAQEIDPWLVDDVRNFLFGPPGSGGFDLASLNLQRGRDHGLASYNETRRQLGLDPARGFADITPNPLWQRQLESVYEEVDRVDLWIGGLCEPPVRDSMVGETFQTILVDQFVRLRDGDRFWYQHDLDGELQGLIERQTLAIIIRRNTGIRGELQDQVFLAPVSVKDDPARGRGPHPGGPRRGGRR